MKYNLIILAFIVLSCGSRKEAQYETEAVEESAAQKKTEQVDDTQDKGLVMSPGIVRDKTAEDGCGYLIEVELNGEKSLFDPLDLADEFKVDGKAVNISYRMSRRPSKCMIAIPIIIDKITE